MKFEDRNDIDFNYIKYNQDADYWEASYQQEVQEDKNSKKVHKQKSAQSNEMNLVDDD